MSQKQSKSNKYKTIKQLNSTIGTFDKKTKRSSFHSKPKTIDKSDFRGKNRKKGESGYSKQMFLNKKIRTAASDLRGEYSKPKYGINSGYPYNGTMVKQVELSKLINTGNKFHLDQKVKQVDEAGRTNGRKASCADWCRTARSTSSFCRSFPTRS